jgi:lysozyme family protein
MTPPTPRFNRYIDWLLPWECVFKRGKFGSIRDEDILTENVPGDAGGKTRHGIDQRSHPSTNIDKLTLDEARRIYFLEYWTPSGAEVMPAGYGEVLADIRVNGGDGPKMLQRALNSLGAGLTVDGRIGPRTVRAMAWAKEAGLAALLRARQERYVRLSRKPGKAKFLKGWTNRNNSLAKFVGVDL